MCEISSNRCQRRLDIFEDLLRLSAEIIQANDLSRLIKSDLTCDINSPPMCYLNHIGIARWRRQSRWIDEANICWISCHFFPLLQFFADSVMFNLVYTSRFAWSKNYTTRCSSLTVSF